MLIGLAAVTLLYFNGRMAGISGIVDDVLRPKEGASKVGLYGQAPSDHPDFAAFLVAPTSILSPSIRTVFSP